MEMEQKNEAIIEKDVAKKMRKPGSDKIIIISIIAVVIILAGTLFGVFYYNTNLKSAITFDGGKVTNSEFTIYYKVFAPMLQYYGYPESIIPEQIANKAALDKILLMKANESGVTLSDEDKKSVDEIFQNEETVETYVKEGIDISKMKQLYYNDYTIEAYINKMKEEANSDEVLAYIKNIYGEDADYNEYDTSHILFKTTDSSTNSAMTDEQKAAVYEKAQGILQRALAGEDFATLAKENSEDGTASNGGQYTMYMDGNTFTEYSSAVATLSVGQIHPTLVESSAGYHIIKLNNIVENGRSKNSSEVEDFVNDKINDMANEYNVNVDEDGLSKIVEQITGKAIEKDDEQNSDENKTEDNTENNGETSTDNTSTEQNSDQGTTAGE